jgi:hypothetical protein
MFFPVKTRSINSELESFFTKMKIKKQIYVPYLSDGCFEIMLTTNNEVVAKPINKVFDILWKCLLKQPAMISKMISICDSDPVSSMVLNRNKIVTCYNLISLTKRSNESVLYNNRLTDKAKTFDEAYLNNLTNFKTTIRLDAYNREMVVFQDLTYLTLEDKQTMLQYSDCLLITKNQKDCLMFDNLNIDSLLDYYILWSKE